MASTITTLTKHYQETGVRNNKPWTRNDFKDDQGVKFATFDAALASKALSLIDVPSVILHDDPNPKYPDSFTFTGIEAQPQLFPTNGNADPEAQQAADPGYFPPSLQIKPVDRNAGLARAIETFATAGVDPLEKQAELFELAEIYAAFGALGQKPKVETVAGAPTV